MTLLSGVIHWGNLPVPYVAAWSSETDLVIRPDPHVEGKPALFRNGRRGLGRPLFGKMDESRVRCVVTRRLCQVCAQPWSQESFAIDVPHGSYGKQPLLSEPPACRKCFEVSVSLCPGIARQLQRPKVLVARVRAYDAIAAFVQYVENGTPDLNAVMRDWKGAPVVGYVKPALSDYDLIDIGDVVGVRA